MEEVKVAIVGEGPSGLMAVAKLIQLASVSESLKKLSLTWFIKRPTHIRRHVINISKNFLVEIQSILEECDNCISKNVGETSPDQLSMSIRTLEYIMFDKINKSIEHLSTPNATTDKSSQFSIEKAGEFKYDEDVIRFNHVFFCDGAWSNGKNNVLFSPEDPFEIITYRYNSPIIILYSGLGPRNISISWKPNNNMSSNKIYLSSKHTREYDISLQKMYDFIAILYNISKNIGIAPNRVKRDLWATGYANLEELENILNVVGKHLSDILKINTVEQLITLLRGQGAFISKTQEKLLIDIQSKEGAVDTLLLKIFNVVRENITDTNNIILSPVLPKISTNGVALGKENAPNLRYARKKHNTYCYLLGDSANAFPPGYSLEISLKSCVVVMETFYSHFIGNLAKPFPEWDIGDLECKALNTFQTGCFWGGYPIKLEVGQKSGSRYCKKLIDLDKRIKIQYFDRVAASDDPFIVEYNKYEFNLFLYYSKFLLCQGEFQLGGSRKTRHRKEKRSTTQRKNIR